MIENDIKDISCQFDIVAVKLNNNAEVEKIEHILNAL